MKIKTIFKYCDRLVKITLEVDNRWLSEAYFHKIDGMEKME